MTPTPKIVYVVGARPNFVKMAPVIARAARAPAGRPARRRPHRPALRPADVARSSSSELGVPEPDHMLGVGSGSHAQQTARVMERLEPVLEERAAGPA